MTGCEPRSSLAWAGDSNEVAKGHQSCKGSGEEAAVFTEQLCGAKATVCGNGGVGESLFSYPVCCSTALRSSATCSWSTCGAVLHPVCAASASPGPRSASSPVDTERV